MFCYADPLLRPSFAWIRKAAIAMANNGFYGSFYLLTVWEKLASQFVFEQL